MTSPVNGNTMIIRWGLGIFGTAFIAIIMLQAQTFSGELKRLGEANLNAQTRLGVIEVMVDNIQDDVIEIKETTKESQKDSKQLGQNIVEIKELILELELQRVQERAEDMILRRGLQPTP